MNIPTPPLKSILMEALEHIKDQSAEDDAQEEILISASADVYSDPIDDDDPDDAVSQVFSLKNTPIEKWDFIVLSDASQFGHSTWNFSSYPHVNKWQVIINFDYDNKVGISLADPGYNHWARICKMLIFYCIPHFAASNYTRSYGSINSSKAQTLQLLQLFKDEHLYIGEIHSKEFRTINDLSRETIDKFILSRPTAGARWQMARVLRFWQKLSAGELVPIEYAVSSKYVSKADLSRYVKEYRETCSPYLPIALDDYSNIINHCIRFVEDYSRDVVWLYDKYYPTVVGGFQYPDRAFLRPEGLSSSSQEGVDAFRRYQPIMHDGRAWWGLSIMEHEHLARRKAKPWGYLPWNRITGLIGSLLDACCVIVLASTGMRRSELMSLRSDCLEQDGEGFWLRYTVFKTSKASQGDKKRIPIPELTAKAIALIDRLSTESRIYGKHDYLFSSLHRAYFGRPTSLGYPANAVTRVAEAVGADDGIHPHRFRKTLAMYLIYQDPKNIEIIRQLFSHVSLKMTLRYVMSLPGISGEIKKILIEQNVDVLLEVITGALNGRIAGEAGKRILRSVNNSPQFLARLQDKGKEGLIQYVESMLEQGIKILHRTNLAVCMKTPGLIEAAPCDGKNEDASMRLHPNIFACDPFGCRFSAFVESNIPDLRNEVIFHGRLINHPFSGEEQKRFSQRRIDAVMKRLDELGEVNDVANEVING